MATSALVNQTPYDFGRWKAYRARLRDGEVNAAQYITEFEQMFASKDEFIDHLKRNSNASRSNS